MYVASMRLLALAALVLASCADPDAELPTTPVVRIVPDAPGDADDLRAEIVTPSIDPLDEGAIIYDYRWFENGEISEVSRPLYSNALTPPRAAMRLEVTPYSADRTRRGVPGVAEVTLVD